MPRKYQWQSRIKAVEREYVAMRHAADRYQQATLDDPSVLRDNLQHREIIAASTMLEATYVIRLFAEFESGARQFWGTRRNTYPKTSDLLDGLATRCRIPDTQLANAHLVRENRNALIHERDDPAEILAIDMARHHLCHFFSFLPERW